MGIKEQLAAAQSNFIPLVEALRFIIDKESVDLATAAKWLLHHDAMDILLSCQLTRTFNLIESDFNNNSHYKIWEALNTIIDEEDNDLPFGFDLGSLDKGEYKSLGFFRDQFYAFMLEHLDSDNANSQPQEINTHLSVEDSLLMKQNYFTKLDIACLISGDSVTDITRCQYDTNFDKNYSGYISALRLIEASIYGFELCFNDDGFISREQVIRFLNDKRIIINGFNNDEGNKHITYEASHNKTLESENTKLKQRIAELEQQLKQSQQVPNKPNTPNDIDLLAHILDPTQDNYAPDLALSIQLYKYVYIDNPNQDSHTNRANLWLAKNTNYNTDRQSGSRIREITAPVNGWNPQRDKKFYKS